MRICRYDSFPGPGILITVKQAIHKSTCSDYVCNDMQGKGYPDVATRHIVKSLADALPRR